MDIDLNAPVISRHNTTIDAPLETVWALHTDVPAWPTWQTDITSAVLDTPFAPGATFSVTPTGRSDSTEHEDTRAQEPGSTHDDQGGDPREGLDDD